jgi:hypothetical protein
MTFISLRPNPPTWGEIIPPGPVPDTLNRVLHPLDDPEWPHVITATGLDKTECWPRKIPAAVFQYAHLMKAVLLPEHGLNPGGLKVLMPGGFEDPLDEALRAMYAVVTVADPASGGMTLGTFLGTSFVRPSFDVVLCASVLEHVDDDAGFLSDILTCLKPGGYAFLTVDYKDGWEPGDPLAPTEKRLYTSGSLLALKGFLDPAVEWCGEPDWRARGDYFHYGGIAYAFAGMAFRKKGGAS